jgi:hypothetical protein
MPAFNIDSKEVTYIPTEEEANQRPVIPINIPRDFMAGRNIFPSRVLAGYNQPVTSGIAFGALMRNRALENPQATAYYWCMGKQSGDNIMHRHLSHHEGPFTYSKQLWEYGRKILLWLSIQGWAAQTRGFCERTSVGRCDCGIGFQVSDFLQYGGSFFVNSH